MALLALPVVMLFAWDGRDTLGPVLYGFFILCMLASPSRRLYATMFVLSLVLELYGTWIGNWVFRSLHLAAITFVAIESLIGMVCPLTQWEDKLRGGTTERWFVSRWLHAILFYDVPEWVFSVLYVAFAVLTTLTIRLVPMRSRASRDA